MAETEVVTKCEEEGCDWGAFPCFYPDNSIYGWEEGTTEVYEPDHYYCSKHAHAAGFCWGCGSFWGGVESFDFGNRDGLCENCSSEYDAEDEEMDDVYSTYPFDNEDDWRYNSED